MLSRDGLAADVLTDCAATLADLCVRDSFDRAEQSRRIVASLPLKMPQATAQGAAEFARNAAVEAGAG